MTILKNFVSRPWPYMVPTKSESFRGSTWEEFTIRKWHVGERKWLEWKSDDPNVLSLCNASFIDEAQIDSLITALQTAKQFLLDRKAFNELAK